jgi:glycosyltransferase involved in cell wall biosynthesis
MDKKPRISACIITFNEEHNIRECLESVKWADEIVVVDSFSQDKTVEIARQYTERVISNKWLGYVAQKNFALSQAKHQWVISIDADERVTPELRDEILTEISVNSADGFLVKRHTHYLGRWINHGGWYPDWKLRIVKKDKARWVGIDPHDKLIIDGQTKYLKGEILHFTYKNLSHQLKIVDKFSDCAVDELLKKETPLCVFNMIFHPPIKFIETYLWKLGFLDGIPGFIISVTSAFYVFVKYAKLWAKKQR